jgi:hypothetical protein
MDINIKVYLHAKEMNFLQSGSFPVNISEFKKDPDWASAIVDYKWIQQIKISFTASEDFQIYQVVYNE